MTELLVPALISVVVFVVMTYILSRSGGEESARARLERMADESGSYTQPSFGYGADNNPETDFLNVEGDRAPFAALGESFLAMMGKDVEATRKDMQLRFIQAGIYSPNALGYYYLFRVVSIPLAVLAAFLLFTSDAIGMMKLLHIIAALASLFLAWYGPAVYITNQKQKRQKILQRSFPDTLDLVLVCVESGLALDAALARVCRELGRAHPEITKELNRTRMELTLLSDRSIALQNLAERTDMVAFRSLVAALLQTEKFGTSLTETLRVLSDDYRHTRLMAAENKAGKLPAMMTIPMILLMMPAFIMIILGPAIIGVLKVMGDK